MGAWMKYGIKDGLLFEISQSFWFMHAKYIDDFTLSHNTTSLIQTS